MILLELHWIFRDHYSIFHPHVHSIPIYSIYTRQPLPKIRNISEDVHYGTMNYCLVSLHTENQETFFSVITWPLKETWACTTHAWPCTKQLHQVIANTYRLSTVYLVGTSHLWLFGSYILMCSLSLVSWVSSTVRGEIGEPAAPPIPDILFIIVI